MEAKDTVNPENIARIRIESNRSDWDLEIAEKQAEISFKAGIKEVVDYLLPFWSNDIPDSMDALDLTPKEWDAKLKEWGTELK